MFALLPLPAKIGMFLWTYLAVSGWFSTYMLISKIGEARRNEMLETFIPKDAFVWTAAVMMLSSFIVIGLLFYGRYNRKKKEVVKAAVKKYEETNVYVDPKMRFDPAVILFWIGGSVLNVLFSLCALVVAVEYLDVASESHVLYMLIGFLISFFVAVIMYLVTQVMANGVLDAKAVKNFMKMIVGSPQTKKVVGTICKKLGIMDQEAVDRIYERVKGRIKSASYDELTPDEVLIVNKAIEESKVASKP
jgi:hypothetical protein